MVMPEKSNGLQRRDSGTSTAIASLATRHTADAAPGAPLKWARDTAPHGACDTREPISEGANAAQFRAATATLRGLTMGQTIHFEREIECDVDGCDHAADNAECLRESYELPAVYAVCADCRGEGKTLTASLRGAFTATELYECFDDEESRAEYLAGGRGAYGVTCETCKGRTTVLVVDAARCDPAVLAVYRSEQDDAARERREDAAIRRAEDGDYSGGY